MLAGVLDIPSSVLLAAINIKEPQAFEKISFSEHLIKHEFLLSGKELTRAVKENLLKNCQAYCPVPMELGHESP